MYSFKYDMQKRRYCRAKSTDMSSIAIHLTEWKPEQSVAVCEFRPTHVRHIMGPGQIDYMFVRVAQPALSSGSEKLTPAPKNRHREFALTLHYNGTKCAGLLRTS